MLQNAREFSGREGWPAVVAMEPAAVVLQQALLHPCAFEIHESARGFDLARPGSRCRMKVCSVRPGHTLLFFYKTSLLPFSRDRFSYGGCEWPDARLSTERARSALDYLAAGLAPAARPAWVRRALSCTVPD